LHRALDPHLDKPLTEAFMPVIDRYLSPQQRLTSAATRAIDAPPLGAAIYQWLVTAQPTIRSWTPLAKLGDAAGLVTLRLLAAMHSQGIVTRFIRLIPGNAVDRTRIELIDLLYSLPADEFRRAVQDLVQTGVGYGDLVSTDTAATIIGIAAQSGAAERQIDADGLAALLKAVLLVDRGDQLAPLAPLVDRLDARTRTEIARLAEARPAHPDFLAALNAYPSVS
ncbi:MAG: hypothetical protein SGJ24_20000, partial [Chloroflexota bacterium]|nr:hypothetical protein [Chloroflexota bacterium]